MAWIRPEAQLERLKVMVLGDYGTGKSYFASTFPEPIFLLDFDQGAIGYARRKVYVPDCLLQPNLEQRAQVVVEQVMRELDLLVRGEHPAGQFETVVVDSLTTLMKLAMETACELRPLAPNSPPIWNVHYPIVKVIVDRLMDKLKRVPARVVVIGHVNYEKNELTGEVVAVPAITGQLKVHIPAVFDEVYFADVVRDKDGLKYVLHLAPTGFKRARSRLRSLYPQIPEVIPNDYNVLLSYIPQQTEQKEGEVQG